jgi:reverse gyrase
MKLLEVVYRALRSGCRDLHSEAEVVSVCGIDGPDSSGSKLKELYRVLEREVEFFKRFFKQCTDYEMWSLQEYWSKRLLSGESFALIAPTGVGKSTLLATYALYKALIYGSKVYVITPTREIAKQMYVKIVEYLEKAKGLGYANANDVRVLFYDSSSKNIALIKSDIINNSFSILITSAAFLSRNQDLLAGKKVDIVIADDLDSILRNSKSVEKVLHLMGFSNEVIEAGLKLVKSRQSLLVAKFSRNQDTVNELQKQVMELEAFMRSRLSQISTQLIVASATGRLKGLKALLLKELLGFDAGAIFEYLRNVDDFYNSIENIDRIIDVIKEAGSGIIFVATLYKDYLKHLEELFRESGIRYAIAKSGSKAVDRFRRGEVDVLIGTASYYGILVRGLDEPQKVRFAAFIGVPHIAKRLDDSLNNVRTMFTVLKALKSMGCNVEEEVKSIVEVIQSSTPAMLALYSKALRGLIEPPDNLSKFVETLKKVKSRVVDEVQRILRTREYIVIENYGVIAKTSNSIYLVKPDPYTYIQASGRTSRMLGGNKTHGIAIVFERYRELVEILEMRLRKLVSFTGFREFKEHLLKETIKKVLESRTSLKTQRDALIDNIKPVLLVVESPTKAKTIASMFGKPAKRVFGDIIVYETVIPLENQVYVGIITATRGHITDLVVDKGFHGVEVNGNEYKVVYDFITKCRDCGAQHVGVYESCPYCGSINVYTSAVACHVLQKLASEVSSVFIATDPDTEGEKIAFDVYNLLFEFNRNIYRMEFSEVTKTAVLKALRNPRGIDVNKVLTQIVRRVADRWIGFELSMYLQNAFNKPWLGAGRVQSPVLLWAVNRYKEYNSKRGYAIVAKWNGYRFQIFLGRVDKAMAEGVARRIAEEGARIIDVVYEERTLNPLPPFTTDTLISEANTFYGYTASKVMALAQNLFELGLITYHRTDSTKVSSVGISIAREALDKLGLLKMYCPRTWGNDEKAEGAHEAIRPTAPLSAEEVVEAIVKGDIGVLTKVSGDHIKLYDLIYRRFLASQMSPAKVVYVRMTLDAEGLRVAVTLPVEVIEPGFTALYQLKLYPQFKNLCPGLIIKFDDVEVVQASEVRLYRVADLVTLMKVHGIGRPSTYAKAIDNNLRHGYIVLSKRRKVAIPTRLGCEVAEVIEKGFTDIVGVDVTKKLEELMDAIEKGRFDVIQALDSIRVVVETIWNRGILSSTYGMAMGIGNAIGTANEVHGAA